MVRRGFQLVLESEPGLTVVAQAGDVASALMCVRQHRPDVLVLDLNMPGGSSLELISKLQAEAPDTRIVVLTMEEEPVFVRAVRQAGALGYVLKEASDTDLIDAVRSVAAGEPYIQRQLAARLVADRLRTQPSD